MALIGRPRDTDSPGAVGPRTPEGISATEKGQQDRIAEGRVARALRLTRMGMSWERAARAFWPLATLMGFGWAALALGVVAGMPGVLLPWVAGLWLLAVLAAAGAGGWRFRRVRPAEAVARLDRTLPGRPLTALADRPALGGEGPLWQAHLAQMRAAAMVARAVRPEAGLAPRDPYALRLAGLVAAVMALIFGGAGQMGQGVRAIAATMGAPAPEAVIPSGPVWEGWAEPPAYTRRPVLYLNALDPDQALELPKGSAVSFRLYSAGTVLEQDVGPATGEDPTAPAFRAEESGVIRIGERSFAVTVLPDAPPAIRAGAAPARRADGRMIQDFEAEDDHGVEGAVARIALDLGAVDRRFGLAVAPEPREAVALELGLPRGDRRRVEGRLAEDLSRHPWANLPVTVTLEARDGIRQLGRSEPVAMPLPGRRFFDPLAATLIELRRDLLWSRENAGRSAEILRAVTWQPEGFVEDDLYAELRGAVRLLEGDGFDAPGRDRLAEALWEAAVLLEDGGLSDALARMRAAQERLSEAIRNGASPDEIARLMDELREATDAYTDMLAEESRPQDQTDSPDRGEAQGQEITGDQIQQMMDEIQRLMNEGRMAEAEALLEQFNRMMENLEVRQGQGQGEGEGRQGSQPMNRLADTLREQQRLSDEAFGDMQRQFGQGGQPGDEGAEGSLADRQRALREELGRQQGLMPGQGSPEGDAARDRLDEAGRAMEEAEEALRRGDAGGALQRQADAIQAMREGMRALGDMMAQEGPDGQEGQQGGEGEEPGQQPGATAEGGQARPYQGQPQLDPLGRESMGGGNVITNGDPLAEGADPARRARDLLDEIRRRSGQLQRPQDERDYLDRLLDRF